MRTIQSSVDSTQMIVRAAIVLHNFMYQTNRAGYCPGRFVDSYDTTEKLKEEEWGRLVPNGDRAGLLNRRFLPNYNSCGV